MVPLLFLRYLWQMWTDFSILSLFECSTQLYNVSFIHVCCISWTYLHKQQMSELPFMTVFQLLSLLEPCY